MPTTFAFSIEAAGILTDADGQPLDTDGNPTTAPEPEQDTEEQA